MNDASLLDTAALRRLSEQLGDDAVLCRFLQRYRSLLARRIARLEDALQEQDAAAWDDALLSLRTSSELAGARALAERTSDLAEDPAPCPSAPLRPVGDSRVLRLTRLREEARATCAQLEDYLRQVEVGRGLRGSS